MFLLMFLLMWHVKNNMTNLHCENKSHMLSLIYTNQIVNLLLRHPLPFYLLWERLSYECYLYSSLSHLCFIGGRDNVTTHGGVWFVAFIFVWFLLLHWRLTGWMFGVSITCVRIVVDIVNFERYLCDIKKRFWGWFNFVW